jgi:hypothetical protein
MATILELRQKKYNPKRVPRSHRLVASNGAVGVWHVAYHGRPEVWRVSVTRAGTWVHVNFDTEHAALVAAGITGAVAA